MTKKYNTGSKNQNNPRTGQIEFAQEITNGDNSKGNKRNKSQNDKSDDA